MLTHRPPAGALKLISLDSADEFWLERFYALYSRVFVLPEEREPVEGFRTVLALNGSGAVQDAFGPLSERITVAVDEASNMVVGATNYILYGYSDRQKFSAFSASAQLNFICVDPAFRKAGIAHFLLDDLEKVLVAYAAGIDPGNSRAFLTCEQNNPERMSAAELEADQAAAQIDPYDRLRWWRKLGFRRLAFPYQQPPLNAGQEACTYLDYYVRFIPPEGQASSLPTEFLKEHLRRFFSVSVGKLVADMNANKEWIGQRDFLNARTDIDVV